MALLVLAIVLSVLNICLVFRGWVCQYTNLYLIFKYISRFRMDNVTHFLGLPIARRRTSFIVFVLSVLNLFSIEGLCLSIPGTQIYMG